MADTDLVFGTFVCRRDDHRAKLDLLEGVWGVTSVRGKDDVIVGKTGRLRLNRIHDRLIIPIGGWMFGIGDTMEERWDDLNVSMTELRDAFDLTITDTLVVTAPYVGVASGSVQLNARPINVVYGDILSIATVKVDIELECVDSPPEWTVSGGGG